MEKENKNCQSCGMPLKRDANDGGTNAEGNKSTLYCSHCYQLGKFTKSDLTTNEMKDLKGKLTQFGITGFLTPLFTGNIPTPQRWKQN